MKKRQRHSAVEYPVAITKKGFYGSLAIGFLLILLLVGQSLLPGYTLSPFDFLNEAYLPYANDVDLPHFKNHYTSDQVHEFYPNGAFQAEQLKEGRFPLWNPYIRGGVAYYENGSYLPLHPLKFLLVFMSVEQVFDLSICLHFFVAFFSMAYYLRKQHLSFFPVLLGSISWTFSAYFIHSIPFERMLAPLSFLPLIVALLEELFQNRDLKSMIYFGGLLGAVLVVSEPLSIFFLLVVLTARTVAMIIWERQCSAWRFLYLLFLGGVIGCLIASVTLTSLLHGLMTNERTIKYAFPYGMVNSLYELATTPIAMVMSSVHPFLLGSRDSLDMMKLVNLNIDGPPYIGSLSFILAFFGIGSCLRERHLRWLPLLVMISLLLLTPWGKEFFKERSTIIFVFPLTILAARGLQNLLAMPEVRQRRAGTLLLWFSSLVLLVFVVRHAVVSRAYNFLHSEISAYVKERFATHFLGRYMDWKLGCVDRFLDLQHLGHYQNVFFLTTLFAFAVLVYLGARRNKALLTAASLVCILPPIFYAMTQIYVIDMKKYPAPEPTPGLDVLKKEIGSGRVLVWHNGSDGRLFLPDNVVSTFAIRQLYGKSSLRPYSPVFMAIPHREWPDLQDLPLDHPLYDELGITHLLASKFSSIDSKYVEEVVYNNELRVLKRPGNPSRCWVVTSLAQKTDNLAAFNRAREDNLPMGERTHYVDSLPSNYVPDKGLGGDCEIILDEANVVEIEANVKRPSLLLLGDTFYPGWVASVDGVEQRILRVDGALRGVWLSPGFHTVRFVYRPVLFYVGVMLSIFGGILWIGLWVGAIVVRRKRK